MPGHAYVGEWWCVCVCLWPGGGADVQHGISIIRISSVSGFCLSFLLLAVGPPPLSSFPASPLPPFSAKKKSKMPEKIASKFAAHLVGR